MGLTKELRELLHFKGAALVGIGDMSTVENCNFKTGVSYILNKKLNEMNYVLAEARRAFMNFPWTRR